MSARVRRSCFLAMALIMCFAPAALSQQVKLQITNPPGDNILDGIYVGPYAANNLTTGGTAQVICDDFKDNSDFTPTTYTVNTISSLGNAIWGAGSVKLYEEAAWLALGLVNQTGTEQGYYSYAVWAVFDPTDVAKWLTSHNDSGACNAVFGSGAWYSGACTPTKGSGGLLATAAVQNLSPSQLASVLILTPNGCTSGPGTCPEQEFFEIVADGGTAVMYLLLAGAVCFGAIRFRSKQQRNA